MRIRVPVRGNRKLRRVIDARQRRPPAQGAGGTSRTSTRSCGCRSTTTPGCTSRSSPTSRSSSCASSSKHGVEPSVVRDYGMTRRGRRGGRRARGAARTASACRCTARGHEDWSLFLAEPKLRELLDGHLRRAGADGRDRPEVLQSITSHRADGEPLSLEAGILRVADALDMAKGRSRIPFERGQVTMHSLSAAAIDEVRIADGEDKPVDDRDRDEQLVRASSRSTGC